MEIIDQTPMLLSMLGGLTAAVTMAPLSVPLLLSGGGVLFTLLM